MTVGVGDTGKEEKKAAKAKVEPLGVFFLYFFFLSLRRLNLVHAWQQKRELEQKKTALERVADPRRLVRDFWENATMGE